MGAEILLHFDPKYDQCDLPRGKVKVGGPRSEGGLQSDKNVAGPSDQH